MKTTPWIKDFVNDLPIASGGNMRMDCPACGHKGSFSVSDKDGQRLWFCFHADCNVRGTTEFRIRRESTRNPFARQIEQPKKTESLSFEMPDSFIPLSRNTKALAYVKKVNAYKSYLDGRADIRYDVRMNRVVYLVKDGRRTVDAAGRALTNIKPKWWRYGKSGHPFVCGESNRVGIILEDCASACSVSDVFSGIALLGTNLQDSHIPVLKRYDRLVVALDKDATDKALEMVRRLQSIRPTGLVILQKDVKEMNTDERERTFRKYIS